MKNIINITKYQLNLSAIRYYSKRAKDMKNIKIIKPIDKFQSIQTFLYTSGYSKIDYI